MIKFRMVKINIGQFAILTDVAPVEGISYTVGLGFSSATNAKRIGCDFSVEFAHNEKPVIKLGVFCEFEISPEDWDGRIKDNSLIVTKDELGFFANQTVGVARGIMFCKTEGSPFSQFIVPPINLVKLIKGDFIIDFTQK